MQMPTGGVGNTETARERNRQNALFCYWSSGKWRETMWSGVLCVGRHGAGGLVAWRFRRAPYRKRKGTKHPQVRRDNTLQTTEKIWLLELAYRSVEKV